MTLKEKYTIKNKKRIKQFIFLYSILVIFFVMYSTLAKYEDTSEGYTKIAVANWKIALNGKELTSSSNTLTDSITLIPTTDENGNDLTTDIDENTPIKIKPGQTGYFDIKIDPTGTEVSFSYQVSLDLMNSVLPRGLNISSYSLDGGTTSNMLPENKTVSNTVLLGNNGIFIDSDVQRIRYYWSWNRDEVGDTSYTIVTNVEVKQVLQE